MASVGNLEVGGDCGAKVGTYDGNLEVGRDSGAEVGTNDGNAEVGRESGAEVGTTDGNLEVFEDSGEIEIIDTSGGILKIDESWNDIQGDWQNKSGAEERSGETENKSVYRELGTGTVQHRAGILEYDSSLAVLYGLSCSNGGYCSILSEGECQTAILCAVITHLSQVLEISDMNTIFYYY